ncbi:MAG: BlaI/MecI/CopY family transcriptional regulator [Phycisphaerae bacterium]|nr:BlaI/MecI/CopY family transcriptional regulator [Phycisphaerae bacterium]
MVQNDLTPLSPAETEILRLVWELSKATVQNVVDRLPPERQIGYATVQTMLRRLEKKGYVRHGREGKAHVFMPAVRREEVIGSAVGSFVDRLFGGDALPLMHYLARHGRISEGDIEKLKQIVNDHSDEEKGE